MIWVWVFPDVISRVWSPCIFCVLLSISLIPPFGCPFNWSAVSHCRSGLWLFSLVFPCPPLNIPHLLSPVTSHWRWWTEVSPHLPLWLPPSQPLGLVCIECGSGAKRRTLPLGGHISQCGRSHQTRKVTHLPLRITPCLDRLLCLLYFVCERSSSTV